MLYLAPPRLAVRPPGLILRRPEGPSRRRGRASLRYQNPHITAPICQGMNSLSPMPSASLLVRSPEAARSTA
jgi:hypothetical protein